jgi:hypothetical protein
LPEWADPLRTVSHAADEAAVHAQPAGTVTATLPCVAEADTSVPVGEMVDVQGTPACVTVKDCPPIESDPLRLAALVLALTAYVSVAAPAPLPPDGTVSHGALLAALQLQPAAVVMPTVPVVAS